MATEHERVEIKNRKSLRAWLQAHHQQQQSIWLVVWKKHTAHYVPYGDIVDECLCFGWIDSQPRTLDTDRSMIRLSPRKPKSGWSGVNKARIEKLMAEGLMTPAGLEKIEQAKTNGSWTALDSASALTPPDDLIDAFARFPASAENFAAFPPSARRAILEWITSARTETTRSARVTETARLAADNVRANQWRPKA